jgi:hypothetical protein
VKGAAGECFEEEREGQHGERRRRIAECAVHNIFWGLGLHPKTGPFSPY